MGRGRSGERRFVHLCWVLLLVAVSNTWVTPGAIADEDGIPPLVGITVLAGWTNDDGTIDDASDAGDVGDLNPNFDAHGTASSDDPGNEGTDPNRYDKDVALCSATIGPGSRHLDVTIIDGYPGYVCTFSVTFMNETGVPADVAPTTILFDPGLLAGEISEPALPSTLAPGESATGEFFVRIGQDAPQEATLSVSVAIELSGLDADCVPLYDTDVPSGGVLVDQTGLCTYFFDAKASSCGPDWDEHTNRFAWHFIVKRPEDAASGALTAHFMSGLVRVDTTAVITDQGRLEFFVYTPTADTIEGAYVTFSGGDSTKAKLGLEGTCNDPLHGGHIDTSDLSLVVAAGPASSDGPTLTYVLTNDGMATASDISVVNWLSPGLTVESVSVVRGEWFDDVWRIGHLDPGESISLVMTATADRPGLYEAGAEVVTAKGMDADSVPGNARLDEDDRATTHVRINAGGSTIPLPNPWLVLAGLLALVGAAGATNHRRSITETYGGIVPRP